MWPLHNTLTRLTRPGHERQRVLSRTVNRVLVGSVSGGQVCDGPAPIPRADAWESVVVSRLPGGSWWDWEVVGWDRATLCLAAGADLTYHHDLEVCFAGVVYGACPESFADPVFREPGDTEQALLRHLDSDVQLQVYAFDVDPPGGNGLLACVIVAALVEVVPGVVYRYWRDHLLPGGRRAPWVRPPRDSANEP
jgi:hypothetical protein